MAVNFLPMKIFLKTFQLFTNYNQNCMNFQKTIKLHLNRELLTDAPRAAIGYRNRFILCLPLHPLPWQQRTTTMPYWSIRLPRLHPHPLLRLLVFPFIQKRGSLGCHAYLHSSLAKTSLLTPTTMPLSIFIIRWAMYVFENKTRYITSRYLLT